MSKLETNTIDTLSGTSNLTIGSTNSSTVTFENGAVTGHMYPAFEANRSSAFVIPNTTVTKVEFNNEVFDTDGYYDNSTNYRFTPLVAGKYMVYSTMTIRENNGTSLNYGYGYIYKNGSNYLQQLVGYFNNPGIYIGTTLNSVIEFNGTTDYVEIFAYMNSTAHTGGSEGIESKSNFGAYRIGA